MRIARSVLWVCMVNLIKEEEIAEEIERHEAYKEDIYDAMTKLKQLLQKNFTADPSAAVAVRKEATIERFHHVRVVT